jgi:DNA-binding GntR family transcriptional regulator
MRPDEIADTLRRALRERVFRPGELLNQDHLARRFGVSRVPLREALRTLVGEGLVVIKPGLGAVVPELEPQEVSELYELRLSIEPQLAEPIIAQISRADVEALAVIAQSMTELGADRFEEWFTLNYRFHRRLYELSGRKHFVRMVVQVLNLVEPYARVHAQALDSRAVMQTQREQTVAALRAQDAASLRSLIVEGIVAAREDLISALRTDQPNPDPDPLARLIDRPGS